MIWGLLGLNQDNKAASAATVCVPSEDYSCLPQWIKLHFDAKDVTHGWLLSQRTTIDTTLRVWWILITRTTCKSKLCVDLKNLTFFVELNTDFSKWQQTSNMEFYLMGLSWSLHGYSIAELQNDCPFLVYGGCNTALGFSSSSWYANVDGMKDLCTAWLLSSQIWIGRRINMYYALVLLSI